MVARPRAPAAGAPDRRQRQRGRLLRRRTARRHPHHLRGAQQPRVRHPRGTVRPAGTLALVHDHPGPPVRRGRLPDPCAARPRRPAVRTPGQRPRRAARASIRRPATPSASARPGAASSWRTSRGASASRTPSAPWPRRRDAAPSVELNIYGRGAEHEAVLAEIEEHGAPARLEGYTSDPAGAFADSSYMLLTSSHEGFGLVLVESMAAGCLPIAYDIEYGPADIVNHGVDGFLVPRADEKALADQVAEVANASRRRLRRMRKAARRRAADFLPSAVLPRWGPVLEAAAERARARAGQPRAVARRGQGARARRRPAPIRRLPARSHHHRRHVGRALGRHRRPCRASSPAPAIGPANRRSTSSSIHRPTGTRSAPPVVEKLASDPSAEHPTTVLRITLDPVDGGAAGRPRGRSSALASAPSTSSTRRNPRPTRRPGSRCPRLDVPAGADPGPPQRPPPGHGLAARRGVRRAGARPRAARRHRHRERRRGQHRRRPRASTEARRSRPSACRTAGTA